MCPYWTDSNPVNIKFCFRSLVCCVWCKSADNLYYVCGALTFTFNAACKKSVMYSFLGFQVDVTIRAVPWIYAVFHLIGYLPCRTMTRVICHLQFGAKEPFNWISCTIASPRIDSSLHHILYQYFQTNFL